tara:strand:+ start:17531 stop:19018 length:1488 start_codon:yes stop_codon:yes gene_type:complete
MDNLKKILNVAQIREADNYTIKNNPITSIELMESAANSFVKALEKEELTSKKIIVVCGPGNNGGDGFAVCRILKRKGFDASALLVKFKETLSPDCEVNKNRLEKVLTIESSSPSFDFSQYDLIIDAIFGSGLNSPIKGFVSEVIEAINIAGKEVYSIDVPSGLSCDTISKYDCIVKSAHVISFQRPKLSFFFTENSDYIKSWEIVDIGLDESFIQGQESIYSILDESVSQYVITRPRQSHKGTYGHALLLAGSYGKMGAAILSAKACLRSGVGLLTSHVPKCGYEIMQISVPESMCLTDENQNILTTLPDIKNFDSVGIGPGIGKDDLTAKMLESLLKSSSQPLVLDADAINIISANKELLKYLPRNTILTPHIKEFDRLVGKSESTPERFEKQLKFSQNHNCIIVLKNAYTTISSPEGRLYFNTSGNQGMATGGSGDVLTGIITGLLAQKYEPIFAAIIAVYFHGKAGDEGVKKRSYTSLIASDIIDKLNIEPV